MRRASHESSATPRFRAKSSAAAMRSSANLSPSMRSLGSLLIVTGIAAGGCAPAPMARVQPKTAAECTFGERKRAACAALERAVLLDARGSTTSVKVVDCGLDGLTAVIEWNPSEELQPWRALVRFGASGPFDALQPVQVDPIVLEWPSEVSPRVPIRLRMSVTASCATNVPDSAIVETEIAPIGPGACAAEARLTGSELRWCTQPLSGEVTYRIREYDPFSARLRHAAYVDIGAKTSWNLDGVSQHPADDAAVRALLDPIWNMPSETSESCRDGGLQVVEARRGERWKAVLRHCSAVVSLAELRRVFERR